MSTFAPSRIRALSRSFHRNGCLQHRGPGKKKETAHWTQEKLRTRPDYPLSEELLEKTRPVAYARTNTRGYSVQMRTQIVSPGLCDDILKYIGPSLEKHKGCDILDLNPGAGLWSSKLHDFLQPRSHVLFESQPEKYEPFLKRLTEQPNSTYKLVKGDCALHEQIEELVVKAGIFPHQKLVSHDDPPPSELNTTLLVTGTLVWDPDKAGMGFSSISKQLSQHYAMHGWMKRGIHSFGPIRSLIWMSENDVITTLPRSMLYFGTTQYLMTKFGWINQVATCGHTPRGGGKAGNIGRDPRYEFESLAKTLKTMQENGMELLAHRREEIHEFAEDIMRLTNGTGIMSARDVNEYLRVAEINGKSTAGLLYEYTRELYRADSQEGGAPRMSGRAGEATMTSKGSYISRSRASNNQYEQFRAERDRIVDIGEEMYELECKILGVSTDQEKQALQKELDKKNADYEASMENFRADLRSSVIMDLDDRLCIRSPVPRLMWDSRPYEPLVFQEDEMWPPSRCALLDFVPSLPRERWDGEAWEFTFDFASALIRYGSESVPAALEHMVHGGSELVNDVPLLRDPAKGGRLDLNHLRVRMLTVEMVDQLCKAWREWPFRPPGADSPRFFHTVLGVGRGIWS
ncbi:hypothetical protein BCR34DRAFT_600918 [Clohesyomyces aquaticus]|uniref:Mitochondrial transcription factor 1 n=1 Tax=Clohesyomyces aquaticus TaxID=1231657 RepID=A0A1Y1ZP30_9PLEO|nr:hypothetical protein BCR34DRAFT_600918 [Clohesyomyces aquaticus]